ncbi:class I SAM-dependent methyltransferase [Natrinema longum]|uniref:Class I SAM-dependent methyltransferase n=1 Tax=Natrinema longum TaxID=370324 RepID=A0A8A2U6Z8_9EURY|nr:class I SAM-dependent methyltransferase [Natrinema longum]MBZ6494324.1 class I SAM-dependent methyltransferase [Natrinema longum]QSW84353.1 class I SAM-dependent methyltransferase [Natrinema longum]
MQRTRFDTEAIVDFSNDTAWEYRFFWSDATRHYGCYDDDHTSHREAMERSNGVYAAKFDVDTTETLLDVGTGRGGVPTRVAAECGIAVHGDFTAELPA